jgi:tRNA (cmo5U34)-methyltransferase
VQADIIGFDFEPCDMVVAYYTLQFVKPKVRQLVFDHVYKALNWGGAFVLFEKVRAPDARFQDIAAALYVDYKLRQGYSGEEILQKSRSLKGVLEPFSTEGNIDLLKRAGFVDIMTVFKYVCFEGFLAIK